MSVKKLFLSVSATALLAGSAFADGGPAPEAPPPPPPVEEEPYTPPPPAAEPAPSIWYAELHGGAVWMSDMEFDTGGYLVGTDMDTGWGAGGALGYRYDNGFRAEIEGTYRTNDGIAFDLPGLLPPETFDASSLSFMLNGIYDFDTGSFLTPYLGAGIGASQVDLETPTAEDDGWAFAYQFIAGFSVPMPNTSIEFFADYRYMSTAGLETDFDGVILDNDEYRTHNAMGGIRINF